MDKETYSEELMTIIVLSGLIQTIYSEAKYLSDKADSIREQNANEAEILRRSSNHLCSYLLIRFSAFMDAYYKLINKNISPDKAKRIKEIFKQVDRERIIKIRNVVLAHHFQDGNSFELGNILEGKYSYWTNDLKDSELFAIVTNEVTEIIKDGINLF